ncbi:DUF3703 domain-containing protein [Geitlerinema sp. PCC 7407]|uniref:DUF3703 domain-containing protein n=1 Tax=Geitlerinema sp. PCC 7407 TaxID=1173025 RepID=UPI00029F81CE|nr:DUF3703 domain-containing protein [Geitlerinema sp. PCC 7407]AFY66291.1 hypothetical protein GEI7407_1807 [Geitlerinema sp. PCC 7407]
MKAMIRQHFESELARAKAATAEQDFEAAWTALQRAHLLGQRDAIAHTVAHWHMLTLAWQQRDFKEIRGQIMPTLLAFPLTLLLGPVRQLRGGKANSNSSENSSIPEDIQQLLEQ